MSLDQSLSVRPYQLIHVVCALGGKAEESPRIGELIDEIRAHPDRPLNLACNVSDAFPYQDPGPAEDTPEGAAYNLKRDLEILHRINLFPGATLPARIIYGRLFDRIGGTLEVCRTEPVRPSVWWSGCGNLTEDNPDFIKGRETLTRDLGLTTDA
ncbi:MAG: hypothetical protein ACYTGH_05315 [Planctomycetota bacterium]|jgi:hypothetical protein